MNSPTKPKNLFWIVSVIALIWNVMGVLAYLGQIYMDDATLQSMTPEEQAYYMNVPPWVTASFAVAVFSGALGSVALLVQKKVAYVLFVISLLGVLVQNVYSFFLQEDILLDGTRMIWPIMVIAISFFLVYFSKGAIKIKILQ